ncbi:unnamed protein product [Candidula unifasciata]|uniref:Heparanase n=1 Tax=Candidula unifasciata TaxID=100452 RepID=A0A8S3ZWR2_9EUPU|nr:unnamed protein product [Candidula unifasciata]
MMTGKRIMAVYLLLILVWSSYALVLDAVEYFEIKQTQTPNATTYNITVLTNASLTACDKEFLSVTIDVDAVRRKWVGFDFSSPKLQRLAEALAPIDLRFGGTMADFLIFSPNSPAKTVKLSPQTDSEKTSRNTNLLQETPKNFTMTGAQWDKLTAFVKTVGWNLIFDFNVFLRRNGVWDPANADKLLNYSVSRGVQFIAFQLGNEPDLYGRYFNVSISPSDLVADFTILRTLISSYSQYKDLSLFGPGVTNVGVRSRSMTYLRKFIEAGGPDVVNEIGIHHYYTNGASATVQDFLNVTKLESLKTVLNVAFNLTRVIPHPVHIRLSETSSCYGGGAVNKSNAYVAGFMWLDKLGVAGLYGLPRVFRQTFIGGSYELVSSRTFNPNPDFYLSLLFKRLVEGPVFPVTSVPEAEQLRVYANCARRDYFRYPVGALVLYYLNLADEKTVLSLTQFSSEDREVFSLTPGDNNGLLSRLVKLNGDILLMPGNDIPLMLPSYQRGDITIEAQSFGFIVIPQASVPACNSFHESATQ